MGGLWAFVDRKGGKGQVLYSVRLSVDSLWKVGVKRGLWRGLKGGDVVVFVAGLGMVNVVYEKRKGAIKEKGVRKGIGWLRGEDLFGKEKEEEAEMEMVVGKEE